MIDILSRLLTIYTKFHYFVSDLLFLHIIAASYCIHQVSYDIAIQVRQYLPSLRQYFPVAAYSILQRATVSQEGTVRELLNKIL